MARQVQLEFEGKSYIWTGKVWYEARTYAIPPDRTVRHLNRLLEPKLARDDATTTDVNALLRQASDAREMLDYARAEKLARRALNLSPGHPGALAVLCSTLRAKGAPRQALNETQAFRNLDYVPLITSRAAALCDLGRWAEAKREIGRALALGEDAAVFSVVQRIKAARPELYQRRRRSASGNRRPGPRP
ncbi:MAG: hypothetical protein ACE5H9_21720 [Anaerolineae bacterium]